MRNLLIAFFLTVALFGAQIQKIKGDRAIIDPVQMPVGSSGIVVHHFDDEHSTIVARAILVKSDEVQFTTFKALAQPNLPKPKLLPQVGDEVIIGYLYDRAIAIAPNFQLYSQITRTLPLDWIHPDLFAAELAKTKHPAPTKEDFENFCDKFALAKVVIALKNEAKVLDCYTFTTLKSLPLAGETNVTKLPFYTRINKISGSLFDFFGSNEINNYYSYYTKLTEQK